MKYFLYEEETDEQYYKIKGRRVSLLMNFTEESSG